MALIVIQHSVVDNFDVDPSQDPKTNPIYAGMLVGLNTSGYVDNAQSVGASGVQPLGIAGDSIADEYRTTAYSAELIINPKGAKRWTSNRVSDFYNETLASGKMTVYFGGGRFATDQYATGDNWTNSQGKKVYPDDSGLFTLSTGTSARPVGYVVKPPSGYPSGVPGVDTDPVFGAAVENSMSLGTFLTVHLSI